VYLHFYPIRIIDMKSPIFKSVVMSLVAKGSGLDVAQLDTDSDIQSFHDPLASESEQHLAAEECAKSMLSINGFETEADPFINRLVSQVMAEAVG